MLRRTPKLTPLIAGVGLIALAGCENLGDTEQRALSGGAAGAAVGAVGSAVAGGDPATGAIVGGGAGAAGGALLEELD